MPIEVSCPSCSGQFRVPDTAAGKKIRCPKCKGAMDVPAAAAEPPPPVEAPEFVPPPVERHAPASAPAESAAPPPQPAAPRVKAAPPPTKPQPQVEAWFLKSEEGEDYGPVPRDELDGWYAEGRITIDCQLLREGTEQWQWAGDVYAELNAAEPQAPADPTPVVGAKAQQKSRAKRPQQTAEAPADEGPPSSRSRMVAGLLGIFLGPLGTHRFYLGYWVLGLAMLATGGGCGIWSLIDAVLVLIGKVPDVDGRRLS